MFEKKVIPQTLSIPDKPLKHVKTKITKSF